jgi:hypothetical protein
MPAGENVCQIQTTHSMRTARPFTAAPAAQPCAEVCTQRPSAYRWAQPFVTPAFFSMPILLMFTGTPSQDRYIRHYRTHKMPLSSFSAFSFSHAFSASTRLRFYRYYAAESTVY